MDEFSSNTVWLVTRKTEILERESFRIALTATVLYSINYTVKYRRIRATYRMILYKYGFPVGIIYTVRFSIIALVATEQSWQKQFRSHLGTILRNSRKVAPRSFLELYQCGSWLCTQCRLYKASFFKPFTLPEIVIKIWEIK